MCLCVFGQDNIDLSRLNALSSINVEDISTVFDSSDYYIEYKDGVVVAQDYFDGSFYYVIDYTNEIIVANYVSLNNSCKKNNAKYTLNSVSYFKKGLFKNKLYIGSNNVYMLQKKKKGVLIISAVER